MGISRMDKYKIGSNEGMSRIKKNQDIYNSTDIGELSRIKTNNNVSIISDAPKEIDIDKIKNYIYSQNNEETEKKRVSLELPKEEKKEVIRREEKDYDINLVLEHARDKRESNYEDNKYRSFNDENASIEILRNININEASKIDEDDDITGPIDELNTEEKTIVELIQDIQNHGNKNKSDEKKDLFDDLMGDEDETVVMGMSSENDDIKDALLNITQDLESSKIPSTEFTNEINLIKEELKQQSLDAEEDEYDETTNTMPKIKTIDKSFYTNSMTFSKSDFEGFEDLEKNAKESNVFSKIAIVIIIIMLIAIVLLILNYVLDWNII